METFAKKRWGAGVMAILLSSCVLCAQDQPDKASDAVYELGDGVTAPKPIYAPNPEYLDKHVRRKSMA